MNTLSSLPPPSFGDLSLRGTAPVAEPTSLASTLGASNDGQPLHVSADAAMRSVDDIERDFLAALCESRPA